MLSEHERYYGLGVGALFLVCSVCSRNTNIITVWAWLRDSMLSEHERYYGLGMDALVIVCSQNTNVIMVWAWMLWHSCRSSLKNAMRGIRSISGSRTLRMCGSCHAGHIRRGRPGVRFLRVYASAEPITINFIKETLHLKSSEGPSHALECLFKVGRKNN